MSLWLFIRESHTLVMEVTIRTIVCAHGEAFRQLGLTNLDLAPATIISGVS